MNDRRLHYIVTAILAGSASYKGAASYDAIAEYAENVMLAVDRLRYKRQKEQRNQPKRPRGVKEST